MLETGRCEFHETVSAPLPVTMIAELVGCRSRTAPGSGRGPTPASRPPAVPPGYEEAEDRRPRPSCGYFHDHIADAGGRWRRARAVPDDYTTMMLQATYEGRRLDDDEAHQVLQLLLIGGIETTTLLLGNLLHRLIVEPGLADALRAGPGLYEVAVEESLRLDSPTLGLFRTPNQPRTVAAWRSPGRQDHGALRRGEPGPARGTNPTASASTVTSTRSVATTAFGHGIHLCLGAPLATARRAGRAADDRRATARRCATTASLTAWRT